MEYKLDMNTIKALRERKGLSQQELADLVGTSQPQIARLEASKRTLSKSWAERLAPHLDTSAANLIFSEGVNSPILEEKMTIGQASDLPNATIRGKLEGEGRKISVFGQAVGGVDGEFVMNGIPLFEVLAPPNLAASNGAYAVAVSGESMSPRYEDGEVCYVDPKRRVKRGDYVIVQLRLEEEGPLLGYVKRFVRHNSEELVLEQLNPPKELRFAADFVVSVHYIAMAGAAT